MEEKTKVFGKDMEFLMTLVGVQKRMNVEAERLEQLIMDMQETNKLKQRLRKMLA